MRRELSLAGAAFPSERTKGPVTVSGLPGVVTVTGAGGRPP